MPKDTGKKARKAPTVHARSGKYAPKAWGLSGGLHEITIPSGGLILARRIGPTEMLKSGVLGKVDILSSIIQSDHIDRVEGRAEPKSPAERERAQAAEIAEMMKDPTKLLSAMEVIDDVTILVVAEPNVLPVPVPIPDPAGTIDPETQEPAMILPDRIMGEIYVDSIPWDDKMFLFQWTLGGTTDLEAFREGLGTGMDSVSAVEGDADAAE